MWTAASQTCPFHSSVCSLQRYGLRGGGGSVYALDREAARSSFFMSNFLCHVTDLEPE